MIDIIPLFNGTAKVFDDIIGSVGGEFINNTVEDEVYKNDKKNKPTIWLLLISIVYMVFCCLVFFSLALIAVQLIISHRIAVEQSDVKYILIASIIAGTAAAFRSWLFAKIDERKAR